MSVNSNGFDTSMFSASQRASAIVVNESYSYINNSLFYALAPAPYYNYFYNFVRRWAWWYDRYVPTFHSAENGIFSTGFAHSLVDGIANLIVGSEVKLKNAHKETDTNVANATLQRAYKWADKAKLTSIIRQGVKYAGALGTSLLKANTKCGEIWCEALRLDDFFFTTSFDGALEEVTCLIKSYTDTSSNVMKSQQIKKSVDPSYNASNDLASKYYLVETRYFKEEEQVVDEVLDDGTIAQVLKKVRVPYVVYNVKQYNGSITNAQMWTPNLQYDCPWGSIPKHIRDLIVKDYAVVRIGEPQRLPFSDSLGCALLRYNNGDGSLAQQPFGQSILTDLISYLMGYDLQYSYFIRDMYQGAGKVFVAKELITNGKNPSALSGMDESMYVGVPQLNDNDNKLPIDKVQFDLRANDWREVRNSIYEAVATQLNISPSSIAGFLSDNSARTAKEVTTESNATDSYIDIQRGALAPYINEWLGVIGGFYGWTDDIEIRFAKTGSNNLDTIIDRILKLKSAKLITQYEALKMYMVDADESEIEEADKRLTEFNAQQSKMQQEADALRFGGMDYSYDTDLGGKESE